MHGPTVYLVDVAWRTDIADAAARDDIDAALDITAVAGAVRDELATWPRMLVERMTADVARQLLDSFAAHAHARECGACRSLRTS